MVRNRVWAACVCFLVVISVQAQTANGVIQGTVRDDSGAIVVGATVKLTDQATNQSRQQKSDAEGIFVFRALPYGQYALEVEQSGFKKETITSIPLEVAQTQELQVSPGRSPLPAITAMCRPSGSSSSR